MHYTKLLGLIAFLTSLQWHVCFGQETSVAMLDIADNIDETIRQTHNAFVYLLLQSDVENTIRDPFVRDASAEEDIDLLNGEHETAMLSLLKLPEKDQQHNAPLFQKLHELCLLQFYKFSCSPKIEPDARARFLTSINNLYRCQIKGSTTGQEQYPFRNILSTMLLTQSYINHSGTSFYEQKSEALAFFLARIKEEIISINNALDKESQVSPESIISLIETFTIIGIDEPFLSEAAIDNLMVAAITVAVTASLVFVWYNWLGGREWVWGTIEDIAGKAADKAGEKLTNKGHEFIDELCKKYPDFEAFIKNPDGKRSAMLKDAGRIFFGEFMAANYEKIIIEKNGVSSLTPDGKLLFDSIGKDITGGILKALTKDNKNLEQLLSNPQYVDELIKKLKDATGSAGSDAVKKGLAGVPGQFFRNMGNTISGGYLFSENSNNSQQQNINNNNINNPPVVVNPNQNVQQPQNNQPPSRPQQ